MDNLQEGRAGKFFFFISMFIGITLLPYSLDNDIWFLLNGGRYVLSSGIPHIEPFTMHPGLHFVMQQWLSGVVFWQIYHTFGPNGLMLLLAAADAAIIYLLYRLCLLASRGSFQISVIIATLIGCVATPLFIRTRPQVFSGLLLLLELFCLEKYSQTGKKLYLAVIPLISAALINLHAALWPMMLVTMLPFIIDSFPIKYKEKIAVYDTSAAVKPLLLCMAGVIAAAFCNPYGLDAMTYLFRSYGYGEINDMVSEMRPIAIDGILGKGVFFLVAVLTICYARIKAPLRYILLTAGTTYMALSAVRSLFLLLLLGLFPLAYIFKDFKPIKYGSSARRGRSYRLRGILLGILSLILTGFAYNYWQKMLQAVLDLSVVAGLAIAVVICAFFLALYSGGKKSGWKLSRDFVWDQTAYFFIGLAAASFIMWENSCYARPDFTPDFKPAIDHLLEDAPADNIVLWTNYNTGNYSEYRGIHSYLDARAEVFLASNNGQKDILKEYAELRAGYIYYKDFIAQYNFTHFLTEKHDILYTYLNYDPDYELIYSDEKYRLFKKTE